METMIKDLINDQKSPWFEFENNFEEGWGGDPNVFCLSNLSHHREVANVAANELAKKYDGNTFFQLADWEIIAQKTYNDTAKRLYPNERLWSGDNEDNPEFWKERHGENPEEYYNEMAYHEFTGSGGCRD